MEEVEMQQGVTYENNVEKMSENSGYLKKGSFAHYTVPSKHLKGKRKKQRYDREEREVDKEIRSYLN